MLFTPLRNLVLSIGATPRSLLAMNRSTSPLHVHIARNTPLHVHVKPSSKKKGLSEVIIMLLNSQLLKPWAFIELEIDCIGYGRTNFVYYIVYRKILKGIDDWSSRLQKWQLAGRWAGVVMDNYLLLSWYRACEPVLPWIPVEEWGLLIGWNHHVHKGHGYHPLPRLHGPRWPGRSVAMALFLQYIILILGPNPSAGDHSR